MNRYKNFLIVTGFLFIAGTIYCQSEKDYTPGNYIQIKKTDTEKQIIEKAANVIPSKKQYEWQKLELTGFIHFGINTFDDVEWGQKNTDLTKFDPKKINVRQWVQTFKDAGFKLIIITAKHHDGFCLWPSKYNDYNIAKTPFQNGKGDILRDLAKACNEAGLKFGIYLSPWDMHENSYGTPEYNTYFINLLTELLTNYGDISEIWFDGACGEGPNGKKQVYDWNSYYKVIHKLQPNAVIAIMGEDVRWVGTESGYGRQTEWSVLPGLYSNQDSISENSQQKDAGGPFVPRDLVDEDLGSREKILDASSLIWYPAEIDVSIRPGWFYHANEDDMVKSPQKLVDIYFNSVGLNGVLLLNVPPDKNGLIHTSDTKSLKGMRYLLDETFRENFVSSAKVRATSETEGNEARNILDNNLDTYWTTDASQSTASIEVQLTRGRTFNCALLQENILAGQRIEEFHIDYWDGQMWRTFVKATTVGYKRLLRFSDVYADRVKIVIDQCRINPTLSSFGLFKSPPELSVVPSSRGFTDSIKINISSFSKQDKIFYTLDGSLPNKNSTLYTGEIKLNKSASINAIGISSDGKISLPVNEIFTKTEYLVEYKIPYSRKYPGTGDLNLVDGLTGSDNFENGKWQGFEGTNLDVVIDLKTKREISKISIRFLNNQNSYIFYPTYIECSVSEDGKNYVPEVKLANEIQNTGNVASGKDFILTLPKKKVKYIHIISHNIGKCPTWHKGAGDNAWIFCNEIKID